MKYGDAGAMLEIESKPSYVTTDFVLPESTLKHKDLEFEIVKSDFLAQRALVARHNSDIVRLFGDIRMRMFELSIAQIQSHFDEYAEVTTARCPLLLWKLVIKSHTFAGREASFVEKEKAKSTLQKLRQSSLTLSEHNSRFDAQLKICKDMQIDVDTKWVIYTYLLTQNVSTFGQLVTMMIAEMDMPKFSRDPRGREAANRPICPSIHPSGTSLSRFRFPRAVSRRFRS